MEEVATATSKYYPNEHLKASIGDAAPWVAGIVALALFRHGEWRWGARPLIAGGTIWTTVALSAWLVPLGKPITRDVRDGNFHAYTRDPNRPAKRIVGWPLSLLARLASVALYPGGPNGKTDAKCERLMIESPLWENGHSTILLNALYFEGKNEEKEFVVISGGNGWSADSCEDAVHEWHERGHSVLIWDYPGYSFSEGSPNVDSCMAGAQRVAEVAKELADGKPLWFYGTSLGGPHAAEMARLHPGCKLTLDRTFGSMWMAASGMVHPVVGPIAQWFFPYNTVASVKQLENVKTLIHWGTNDELFGQEHGKALHEASGKKAHLQSTNNAHNGRSQEGVLHKSEIRIVLGFGSGAVADVRHILGRVGAHVCFRIQGRMPVQGVQSVFMQHTLTRASQTPFR